VPGSTPATRGSLISPVAVLEGKDAVAPVISVGVGGQRR
jgi:hypothetical protein